MQFLHTVHYIVFNNLYNLYWNCYLFYSHWYFKNDDARVMLDTRTETTIVSYIRCVKSVHIRSYSGPDFPAFRLNTD